MCMHMHMLTCYMHMCMHMHMHMQHATCIYARVSSLQAEGAGIAAGLHLGDRIVAIQGKVRHGPPASDTTDHLATHLLTYFLTTHY